MQICRTCEQGAAQHKRGEKGQERARHHGTVPRGGMRSIQCVRFEVRPVRRPVARESASPRGGVVDSMKLLQALDDPDYALDAWKTRNLEFFHFIFVSKLPKLPEWCTDKFFILKVAGS